MLQNLFSIPLPVAFYFLAALATVLLIYNAGKPNVR